MEAEDAHFVMEPVEFQQLEHVQEAHHVEVAQDVEEAEFAHIVAAGVVHFAMVLEDVQHVEH